ncbi:hypothetical protein WEH80_26355 [Actinomycetes bacterium KLBMP 9759]
MQFQAAARDGRRSGAEYRVVMVDADRWWQLNTEEATAVAAGVAQRTGARLVGVRPHGFADRAGHVAEFDVDGVRYGLAPGGEVEVGLDANRFTPTPQQLEEHRRLVSDFGHPADFIEFLSSTTTPRRRAVVPPLLVAVQAHEARGLDDESDAWPTYAEELDRLAAEGRRLLTPDEWEHACGAGAATLFRWGDDHPTGFRPDEAQPGPHREPNAFGLEIGQDPYQAERTADPDVVCGGDGGTLICGGSGPFLNWLGIATSFRETGYGTWLIENEDVVEEQYVRAAIPLGRL